MLTRLHLTNFKNFADATLELGPFTVLVGTNASGKSNVRDALRFLHGIGRRYSIAETVGRKYSEAGGLEWGGIRGGVKEIIRYGANNFSLNAYVRMELMQSFKIAPLVSYQINVCVNNIDRGLDIEYEGLSLGKRILAYVLHKRGEFDRKLMRFNESVVVLDGVRKSIHRTRQAIQLMGEDLFGKVDSRSSFLSQAFVGKRLLQYYKRLKVEGELRESMDAINLLVNEFAGIRFLEPDPDAMRRPSVSGSINLGEKGENLSAVLQDICSDSIRKQTLMTWLAELTPMDVVDFEFPSDLTGAVLAVLVERSGRKVSAYSASDGTLRFLAILAALLGRERGKCYFIEEIDNGLHPARLHLLVELIERQTAAGHVQVIASTHSPQLLDLLSPASREHASLIYRLPDSDDARITRIVDLPNAKDVLQSDSLAELHASGWLENAAAFGADPEPS